jgi:metal-sulfur cluster biosynthetic enzyme
MAELEDRVWSTVGATVQDPEIDVDLKTLGWMNRRLAISEDTTVQILLTLPTLLHPSLGELKNLVKSAAEHEIRQWSSEKGLDAEIKVNVEAIASKPVPWMSKDAEDQKDIESRLGPGLANVAHILAVYSCKVRTVWDVHVHVYISFMW